MIKLRNKLLTEKMITITCDCGQELDYEIDEDGSIKTDPCEYCIDTAWDNGYVASQEEGNEDSYNAGYEEGRNDGLADGYNEGESVGYDAGYEAAKEEFEDECTKCGGV